MFSLTDEHMAYWAAAPDSWFPETRSIWPDDIGRLGELPRSGIGLRVLCCGCWAQRWIGGAEICRRWPELLTVPGRAWAAALKCEDCGAKRFRLMPEADPAAAGYGDSQSTGPMIAARRLHAWLSGGPVSVHDLVGKLRDMPTETEMKAMGL